MNFIIGGTGLVGSHLLLELLNRREKVKVLKRSVSNTNQVLETFRFYTSNAEKLFHDIEWVEGDILDFQAIELALENVSHVYHCAAMVSFSPKNKYHMLRTNVEGTANIVNACKRKPHIKLCFVSSIAAIGSAENNELIAETHMWKPGEQRSVYSISKFKSEMEVWRGIEEGLNAVIVNPSVIIGPGNWKKSSSAFFPLISNGMKYYTNGITGFVDVRDVVKIMVQLMKSEISGERFIVSSENRSFRELFATIAKYLNVKPPKYEATRSILLIGSFLDKIRSWITFSPRKISSDTISAAICKDCYSNKKVSDKLNYSFIPFETMIQECAAKYAK
jgi:nucleoside-diphosphate-sugar epimerase